MSCFHPNLIRCYVDYSGALQYQFCGPATFTLDLDKIDAPLRDPRSFGTKADLATKGEYYIPVPCGHCVGCKLDYSRQWANRMLLELESSGHAVFVTLTYDNEHLPIVYREIYDDEGNCKRIPYQTLSVRDTQLFWKRLRKHFRNKKIRYFLAGEYGSRTHRPHYHAMIFGLDLNDFKELRVVGYNKAGQPLFTTPDIADFWQNGIISVAPATWHTCAYTSRYCLKKAFGDDGSYHSRFGLVHREFITCSRKPGLGLQNYERYISSGDTKFSVDGRDGVYDIPIPRAMLKKAIRDQYRPDIVQELVENRILSQQDKLFATLSRTGKSYMQYLLDEERDLVAKTRILQHRM